MCNKVEFYSNNNCEKLITSSKDDICIKAGHACMEINSEKYNDNHDINENNVDINKEKTDIITNEYIDENKEKNNGMTKLSISFSIIYFLLFL